MKLKCLLDPEKINSMNFAYLVPLEKNKKNEIFRNKTIFPKSKYNLMKAKALLLNTFSRKIRNSNLCYQNYKKMKKRVNLRIQFIEFR